MLPLPGLSSLPASRSWSNLMAVCFRRTAAFWRCARSSNAFGSPIGSPHDRSSRGRSDHAQQRNHPFSTADDQRRLRGRQRRQCAAPRSDVQDGARSFAHRSGVDIAVDNIAVKEDLPDVEPCCAWAAPWSIFIANPSPRLPNGLCSTSTTLSMRFMAANSCGYSTRITTNMGFNFDRRVRQRRPLRHRRASSAKRPRRQEIKPFLKPVARDPRSLA